jgi:hypothetical protein
MVAASFPENPESKKETMIKKEKNILMQTN